MTDSTDASSRLDGIVPVFVIAYAVWTVYVHAITVTHACFDTLMRWLPLLLLLAATLVWHWFKLPASPIPAEQIPVTAPTPTQGSRYQLTILSMAIAWTSLLIAGGHYDLFWWGSVVALGAAWIATIDTNPNAFHRQPIDRRSLLIVAGVALAAACVTLIANRPDADDAFYQSIPATLLRLPTQPVLLHDTIYRLANLPIQLPVYRMHSYEVLIGVLVRITGVQPAVIAYLLLPPLFAMLCVVAWTQLLRLLAPKQWASTLIVLFLCVLMLGEAHHSYGNFAFVRMFQGKAILASFIVPCIICMAIEYSRHGTARNWIALFASQIAAIGITSTGLFVAPVAVGLALLGAWSPNAVSTRRLILGVFASSYLFVVAAALASITHGGNDFVSAEAMPPMLPWLGENLGSWSTALLLTTLLACWAFAEGRAQSRLLLTSALCFLLAVLNPYTCRFVADHFTGTSTYWRLFWALPAPFMLAILLGNLARLAARAKPRALALAMCLLLAAGFAVLFQHAETLRKGNFVGLGIPGLKVPAVEYSLAKNIAATTPENTTILAAEPVATWLSTFVVHPQLLASRGMYLTGTFGKAEGSRRFALQSYIEGWQRTADAPAKLAAALKGDALTTVIVTHAAPWRMEIAQILSAHGWHCAARGSYDVWTKDDRPASTP